MLDLCLIRELFEVLGIKTDGTLFQLNEIAQREFLRKPGQERWEMAPSKYEDRKKLLFPILDKIGVIKEVCPSSCSYDYILVNGAVLSRMRSRLQYLDKIWVSFSEKTKEHVKLVFLTGDRDLDSRCESPAILVKQKNSSVPFREGWIPPRILPKNEGELAIMLWDQIIENEELRTKINKGDILFVNTPRIGEPPRRPQTRDAIHYWINSWKNLPFYSYEYKEFWSRIHKAPNKARYLAISNNPFILYQQEVVEKSLKKENLLGEGAFIETVGPAAPLNTSIAVHLDNIARTLYEEST